jgi:hypothetical protein
MREVISDLIVFLGSPSVTGSLSEQVERFGVRIMRLFALNLLDWLRARAHYPRCYPMALNAELKLHADFREIVRSNAALTELFVANEDYLEFRADVPEDERNNIVSVVDERYRPRVMTTIGTRQGAR